MSFGMMLFAGGIVGLSGTLIWIVIDRAAAKKKEDRLVYQALEKSYGGDTEKLKEVHTAVTLSRMTAASGTFGRSRTKTAPTSRAKTAAEETEILTEKIDV